MKTLRFATALLVLGASLSLSAQRMGGGVGGGAHGGGGARVGGGLVSGGNGFHGGKGGNFGHRHGFPGYGYGYYWPVYGAYGGYWDSPWDLPDYGPSDYRPEDQAYSPASQNTAAPVVMMQSSQPAAYVPAPSPKLIEVPQEGPASAPRNLPPALFVLSSGEKIETDRYMLSAKSLSVDVGRQQRTIPLSDVNIDATLAVNHQRGLDISIPRDSNSIVLGF